MKPSFPRIGFVYRLPTLRFFGFDAPGSAVQLCNPPARYLRRLVAVAVTPRKYFLSWSVSPALDRLPRRRSPVPCSSSQSCIVIPSLSQPDVTVYVQNFHQRNEFHCSGVVAWISALLPSSSRAPYHGSVPTQSTVSR